MKLTTPESIRTLQRKLYRKAKQEPACRFYSLYDKVYRADILGHAYRLVRSNGGGPGVDGVTFRDIEEGEGISVFLAELEEVLRNKTYRASPILRKRIPKSGGKTRLLGIPVIRDRVVQMAVKLVIEPVFEADFCDSSYGFRPKRSAHDALSAVTYALNRGHTTVIDADISEYFDSIPHSELLSLIAERISDGKILRLIKMWLKASIIEKGKDGRKRNIGGGRSNRHGTPQGGVISPLLSNLYLHTLDKIWDEECLQQRLGACLVRYADDFLVLCREGTASSFEVIERVLNQLDLRLNREKTRIVNSTEESFTFLGFEIRMKKSRRTGNIYPHVQPSRESLAKIRKRIRWLTRRERTCLQLPEIVDEVNSVLRGWVNYFHYGHCSRKLQNIRSHTEERLRNHLCKRHRIVYRSVGYKRFRNRILYERYGLYKVPATAGWTRAHALR